MTTQFAHGSRSVLQLGTAGTPGTPVAITQFVSNVDYTNERGEVGVTTLGATAESFLPGLHNGSFSFEGPLSSAVAVHLGGIHNVQGEVAFVYGPMGGTSGLPRYSGVGFLRTFNMTSGTDDASRYTAEFRVSGPAPLSTF